MLTTLLLSAVLAAPGGAKDSPKAIEVFAREDFYKKQEATEQEYSGYLQRISAPPGAAVGPSHPYRVVMIKSEQREREVLVNGKAVKRPYTTQYLVVYNLYVDGRGELLEPLIGKQVKVTGKSVTSEANGDPEVWPGRVEVVVPPQTPAPPPNAPAFQKDPPKTVEIFAKDDFYQKQDAKEETITGTVQRITASSTGTKTGRNNPYRLTGTTYREVERQRVVNGKVEKVTEKVPITVNFELYVAGKGELLEPFVGKRVKITGKQVQVDVGGKKFNEFWPAQVELDESKDAPKKEDPRPKLPPPPANAPQKEAPKAVEVFAKEDFYKKQEGKEDTFTGTVQRAEKAGPGFGRNNPYRLTVISYKEVVVERLVNGKVEKTTEKVPLAANYELYVAGKGELLEPFIGKQVKVTGKRVLMEVEGKKHDEIWPARIELEEAKKPQAPSDDGCCTDDGDTPLKILARAPWPFESANPKDVGKPGRQTVIRSLDELITLPPYVNRDAPPEAVKQAAAADMAKLFKVDAVDWKKQMIVVVSAGVQNSGGFKIDITAVTVADKKITVAWRLDPPKGAATDAFTHPAVMALVERAEGEVRFVQSPAGKLELPKRQEPSAPQAAGDGKELKVLAKAPTRFGNVPEGGQKVITSAKEAAAATGKGDGADAEKDATANLAKLLKTDEIDWSRQMVVSLSGGVRRIGGYSVEVVSAVVKDKKLVITWKVNSPKPGSPVTQALTHPSLTVLLERFDGPIEFDPPMAPGVQKKDRE